MSEGGEGVLCVCSTLRHGEPHPLCQGGEGVGPTLQGAHTETVEATPGHTYTCCVFPSWMSTISSTAPPQNIFLVWATLQAQGWGQYIGCPCPQCLVILSPLFQVLVLEADTAVYAVSPSSSFYLADLQAIQTPGEDYGQVSCAPVLA